MSTLEDKIRAVVDESLRSAEKKWDKSGPLLVKSAVSNERITEDTSVSSFIPGYPVVTDSEALVDTFIAVMVDMCNSSEHLTCHIEDAAVSKLQRVFYETSVLLAAIGATVNEFDGAVTEYLGDGALALFLVDKSSPEETVRKSFKACKSILGVTLPIINQEIAERYNLPSLSVKIGMGMSEALLTIVGGSDGRHPKAFGECVFRAAKFADTPNKIRIDNIVKGNWPSSKGGKVEFVHKRHQIRHDSYKVVY